MWADWLVTNRRIIRFSHSAAQASGESRVGGLVGWNSAGSRGQEASITASFATGERDRRL